MNKSLDTKHNIDILDKKTFLSVLDFSSTTIMFFSLIIPFLILFFGKTLILSYSEPALAAAIADEICGNLIDDNLDGRVDEAFPGGIQTNMQLWLKAEQGTNTTINGQNINAWADQSINSYSADADVNATDYPTYTTDAINFNPGINFDGDYTDDASDGLHLGSDYIFSTNLGMHVFVVCDPNVDAETDNYVFDFGLQANGGYGMIYSNDDYGMYTNNTYGGANTELFHSDGDEPALVEFEVDFDDFQTFFRNGTSMAAIPVTIAQLTASEVLEIDSFGVASSYGPVTIGRKSASVYLANDGGRMFDGNISEVIVYNDLLSVSDKAKVNSYLAIKYGITLNQDYVSSSGATLKTITDGYANDVFSIGRDDCAGLNQKQSTSVGAESILAIARNTLSATNQSNTNTFASNESFLIVGNNGAAESVAWTPVSPGNSFHRIDREWHFNSINYAEITQLTIDVDDPDFDLPALPAASNGQYYIIADTDNNFTNGGTSYIPISNWIGGSRYQEQFTIGLTSYYFTIGVFLVEDCNNLIDDDGDGDIDCADVDCTCCLSKAPVLAK